MEVGKNGAPPQCPVCGHIMFWGNNRCDVCSPLNTSKRNKRDWEKINLYINACIVILALSFVLFAIIALGIVSYKLLGALNPSSSSYATDSAQLYSALATIILTGVTIFVLIENSLTTKENTRLTKLMAEAQTDPTVTVEIGPAETNKLLQMIVKNVGEGIAKNITFLDVPDFEIFKDKKLSNIGFIKLGIKYMAPGQSYKTVITHIDECVKNNGTSKLTFSIQYESITGKKFEEAIEIDFEAFRGVDYFINRGIVSYQ